MPLSHRTARGVARAVADALLPFARKDDLPHLRASRATSSARFRRLRAESVRSATIRFPARAQNLARGRAVPSPNALQPAFAHVNRCRSNRFCNHVTFWRTGTNTSAAHATSPPHAKEPRSLGAPCGLTGCQVLNTCVWEVLHAAVGGGGDVRRRFGARPLPRPSRRCEHGSRFRCSRRRSCRLRPRRCAPRCR